VRPQQFAALGAEGPDGRRLGIARHQRAADVQDINRCAGVGVDLEGFARGGVKGLEFALVDHVEPVGRRDRQDAPLDTTPRAIQARRRRVESAVPQEQAVERIAGVDAVSE